MYVDRLYHSVIDWLGMSNQKFRWLVRSFPEPLFPYDDSVNIFHPILECKALDILIGCLRTMVNLTNYNSSWASELSTPSVLQALCGLLAICREGYNQHRSSPYMVGNQEPPNVPVDHLLDPSSTVNQFQHTNPPSLIDNRVDEVVFDLLCVCLGLLANLLEQSAQATDMLRQTRWFFSLLWHGAVHVSHKTYLIDISFPCGGMLSKTRRSYHFHRTTTNLGSLSNLWFWGIDEVVHQSPLQEIGKFWFVNWWCDSARKNNRVIYGFVDPN